MYYGRAIIRVNRATGRHAAARDSQFLLPVVTDDSGYISSLVTKHSVPQSFTPII